MNTRTSSIIGISVAILAISTILVITVEISQPQSIDAVESKLIIHTSFYPYTEFTKNIVKDNGLVVQYIPIGGEIHHWEPKPKDIIILQKSSALVYNGLGVEPYIDNLLDSNELRKLEFIKATKGIELKKNEKFKDGDEHEHQEGDPHVWLDPLLVREQIKNIRNDLIKIDLNNSKKYKQNMLEYDLKLKKLHDDIKSQTVDCERDTILVFHNAFKYFANRYNIKILSLKHNTEHSENTAQDIKHFIDTIRENNLKYILIDEFSDSRLLKSIVEETDVKILTLSTLESITIQEHENNITYIDKMRENLQNIKIALGCS